jgi:5-methylcytosine-specific restriction endonuclease McrA
MNQELRQQVLERDNHTCQECGASVRKATTCK